MASTGVTTRARNANQHPGSVVQSKPRRTTEQVEAERQAKKKAKEDKEHTKTANIKRVAEYEKGQADLDANDVTPRVANKAKPLTRTRSYADVLAYREPVQDSDVDMNFGDDSNAFILGEVVEEEGTTTESDPGVQTSPPRKRAKVAPKPKVRAAIKAVQVAAVEKKKGGSKSKAAASIVSTNRDDSHADLTKTKRHLVPAAESDMASKPSWRMPAADSSDDNSIALDLAPKRDGSEGKLAKVVGKGKGKEKELDQIDGNHGAGHDAAQKQKRHLPNSKRQVFSHLGESSTTCSLSTKRPSIIIFLVTLLPKAERNSHLASTIGLPPYLAT
jgi:hypothetical protein